MVTVHPMPGILPNTLSSNKLTFNITKNLNSPLPVRLPVVVSTKYLLTVNLGVRSK